MNTLQKIALTGAVALQTASPAFAQLTSAPKSSGPTGSQVMSDLQAWLASHQGVAVALAAVIVLALGYTIYGFINKPSK